MEHDLVRKGNKPSGNPFPTSMFEGREEWHIPSASVIYALISFDELCFLKVEGVLWE